MSGDNLAVYSDNHKYCFRCGHYETGDKLEQVKQISQEVITLSNGFEFPQVVLFTEECLEYLKIFNLTKEEIYANLKGHEDGYSYFDNKFFLIRRLHKQPKVIVKGEVVGNEPIFGSGSEENTVVLCEDIISAIKVSRVLDSCALLKTTIHDLLLLRLARKYSKCIIWLDYDVRTYVVSKLLPKVRPFFTEVRVIFSEKDPKYYSTKEIKEYLK